MRAFAFVTFAILCLGLPFGVKGTPTPTPKVDKYVELELHDMVKTGVRLRKCGYENKLQDLLTQIYPKWKNQSLEFWVDLLARVNKGQTPLKIAMELSEKVNRTMLKTHHGTLCLVKKEERTIVVLDFVDQIKKDKKDQEGKTQEEKCQELEKEVSCLATAENFSKSFNDGESDSMALNKIELAAKESMRKLEAMVNADDAKFVEDICLDFGEIPPFDCEKYAGQLRSRYHQPQEKKEKLEEIKKEATDEIKRIGTAVKQGKTPSEVCNPKLPDQPDQPNQRGLVNQV